MSDYPLHDKLTAISSEARDAIGDFVVWLEDNDLVIVGEYSGDEQRMVPEEWIGRFYDIDPAGLAAEKDAMLAKIRHDTDRADLVKVRDRLKGRADGDGGTPSPTG